MIQPRNRRALSPVIATIIISGVVLAVGGAVWSFVAGASTVLTYQYVNETLELVKEVTERFRVEHIYYNTTTDYLHIWVFNYGSMTITVDTYISIDSGTPTPILGTVIDSGESVQISADLSAYSLTVLDEINVKIHSRRQNNAYSTHIIS